jgi:RNA polymerase sigma factor (sigma-70 family)
MLSSIVLRTQSDEGLAQLAARGSEPAFEAIVQRYRRPLLGYCRRLLLSDSHSEDVVQQTFLNAWTALRRQTEVRDVKPWLYRITHNQAMSALRRPGWDFAELNESLLNGNPRDGELDGRIVMRETLAAVAALPGMQREVILRTAVEGRSYEEVAGELGVSEESVRGLVYRARASLRAGFAVVAPEGLVLWAAGLTRRCASSRWLPEVLSGGGSAGGAAVVVKGAVVIASSAAVIGGSVGFAFKPHPRSPDVTTHARVAHRAVDERAPAILRASAGPSDRGAIGRPGSAAGFSAPSVHSPASNGQHLHLVAAVASAGTTARTGSSRATAPASGSRPSSSHPAPSSQPDGSHVGSKIPMQGNARIAGSPPSDGSATAPADGASAAPSAGTTGAVGAGGASR